MLTFTDEQLHQKMHDELHAHADFPSLSFTDVAQSVRDDVAAISASPLLLKGLPVRGFVYDVRTGRLHEVD